MGVLTRNGSSNQVGRDLNMVSKCIFLLIKGMLDTWIYVLKRKLYRSQFQIRALNRLIGKGLGCIT